MFETAFYRLAWKEYRQQRELMLAIAIITGLIFALVSLIQYLSGDAQWVAVMYHIALAMPVFYALGCGAMLFAGEHERETFAFLRSLPLRSPEVFWAKAAVGIVSSLVMTAALALAAALVTRFQPVSSAEGRVEFEIYLFSMLIVLVCSAFYSLLLKNPLWAVAAAGVTYVAGLMAIALVLAMLDDWLNLDQDRPWLLFEVASAILFLAMSAATVLLGRRWLERKPGTIAQTTPAPLDEVVMPLHPSTPATRLGRLLWQSLREAGGLYLAAYAGVFLLTALLLMNQAVPAVIGVLPALLGSLAFFHDQWKQHHRFFAEHGVSARTIWWSRIGASLLATVPWLVVVVVTIFNVTPRSDNEFVWPHDLLPLAVLTFAAGQLCSLLFRAGIVGVFAGLGLSVMLAMGVVVLRTLGIPDWLGVYPLAGILLWASWLRAPQWLAERDSWSRWLQWGAIVAAPLALYLIALGAHRTYEIPAYGDRTAFGSSTLAQRYGRAYEELMRPATAEERLTADLYRSLAIEMRTLPYPYVEPAMGSHAGGGTSGATSPGLVPQPGNDTGSDVRDAAVSSAPAATASPEDIAKIEATWHEAFAKVAARFVEASKRESCDMIGDPLGALSPQQSVLPREIVTPMLSHARYLAHHEQREQALECHLALLRFLQHFQQRGGVMQIMSSVAMEQVVLDALVEFMAGASADQSEALAATLQEPPYNWSMDAEIAWLREHLLVRAMVNLDEGAWKTAEFWPEHPPVAYRILQFMPWERERSRRLLDFMSNNPAGSQEQVREWQGNTILGHVYSTPLAVDFPQLQTSQNTNRAAARLRLLLLAWKAKHEALPESLAALGEAYPGQVPSDPATQRPFIYRPQGIEVPIQRHTNEPLREGTPFVWSRGPLRSLNPTIEQHYQSAYDALQSGDDGPAAGTIGGSSSLWQQGRTYVIPTQKE